MDSVLLQAPSMAALYDYASRWPRTYLSAHPSSFTLASICLHSVPLELSICQLLVPLSVTNSTSVDSALIARGEVGADEHDLNSGISRIAISTVILAFLSPVNIRS